MSVLPDTASERHSPRLVCSQTASRQNQPAAPGEAFILLRPLFSLLTHIHPGWLDVKPPTPLPSFLYLPSLHWACEGEPVPSGTTVQIAVLPVQIGYALL